MSPVNLAIIALVVLLGIAAVGFVIGTWLRPLLAKADTVHLSDAGRGRRKQPTIDRGASSVKSRNVERAKP